MEMLMTSEEDASSINNQWQSSGEREKWKFEKIAWWLPSFGFSLSFLTLRFEIYGFSFKLFKAVGKCQVKAERNPRRISRSA